MKQAIKFLPNLFTLGNAFMGFLGLVFIAREQMIWAIYCVVIALVLDFLDGFVARLVGASSELGRELDSLADLITFGALPGFIVFQMISITHGYYFIPIKEWPVSEIMLCSIAGVIPMAAALRLAKFNLITEKHDHFLGMPVPAMTMFVIGIPVVLELNYHLNFYHPLSDSFVEQMAGIRKWDLTDEWIVKLLYTDWFYYILSFALATLMLSRLPMISLKFNGLKWKPNRWRYGLLIWLAVSYIIFVIPYIWELPFTYGLIDYLILPIIMLGYFILSVIYATFGVSKK